MNARHLILLSPYRLPTTSTLYLGDDEVAAFLNGHAALWHPAALALALPATLAAPPPREDAGVPGPFDEGAAAAEEQGEAGEQGAAPPEEGEAPQGRLPTVGSPYDYEQPEPHQIFVVPEGPPLMLPDDWEQRVGAAGAVLVKATADRGQTLAALLAALAPLDDRAARLAKLPPEQVGPFQGLGFGHLQLEALFEAMSHDNVLASADFAADVAAALVALEAPDSADGYRAHLQSAAERLLAAREVVYAVPVHLIDLCLLDGDRLDAPWPAAFDRGVPCNFLGCSALLERLGKERPDRLAALREKVAGDLAEVCGGEHLEREEPLLPLESQLWNLRQGQAVYKELLDQEVRVFARKRFGAHPQLPLLLQSMGIGHAVLVAFDEAVLPAHRAPVVSWPSPDGKQVETFARAPHPADTPQTGFHLAYHLHQTIMQDQAATLALLHRGKPAAGWYDDLLELSRLAPVLGRFATLSGFFQEVMTGDYASAASPDEMHGDYLSERTGALPEGEGSGTAPARPAVPHPVAGFARHVRGRRQLDTAWALAALLRALGGKLADVEGEPFEEYLARLEGQLERGFAGKGAPTAEELRQAQDRAAAGLAQRLVARGQENNPGFLVLNPCSFTRRVTLELPGVAAPLPLAGPLKACQVEGGNARVVVEVPALGFAWVPKHGGPAAAPPSGRLRLADERCVRNEFFEAEVDGQTGGLRAIRDMRNRISRVGQQLVFNPGSTMRAKEIKTTSTGPAYGEVVSEGALLGAGQEVLATFRQRFRAWIGRPVLDLRVELFPSSPPQGYPWHQYYAARFAWRDERALLLRGSQGLASVTSHTRPETPDFLEVRGPGHNTVLLPGGLPFHQRHGGRMVDVLLVTPGETAQAFELGVGLDRDHPMQTALGMVSPVALVPTDKGPPHVGASGWLFHLDAPNLLMTSFRPAPEGAPGVTARLLECAGYGGPAELRCVRDPKRAVLLGAGDTVLLDATVQGDAVQLEVTPNDLVQVRVEFA
jgi:alpha-mannosidase